MIFVTIWVCKDQFVLTTRVKGKKRRQEITDKLIPSYSAVLSAMFWLYLSFEYPQSALSIFPLIDAVKGSVLNAALVGLLFFGLLVALEFSNSPLLNAISLFTLTCILVPSLSIGFLESTAVAGSGAKLLATFLLFAGKAEIRRWKERKTNHAKLSRSSGRRKPNQAKKGSSMGKSSTSKIRNTKIVNLKRKTSNT